jgi:hypothetical protein
MPLLTAKNPGNRKSPQKIDPRYRPPARLNNCPARRLPQGANLPDFPRLLLYILSPSAPKLCGLPLIFLQ